MLFVAIIINLPEDGSHLFSLQTVSENAFLYCGSSGLIIHSLCSFCSLISWKIPQRDYLYFSVSVDHGLDTREKGYHALTWV